MFRAQSCRGPEQQHQHGNPDHPACDPDFPQEGMYRRQNLLSLHPHQDRPAQASKFSDASGLRVTSHYLDVPAKMLFLDKPRYTGLAQQHRRKPEFFEIDGPLVGRIRVGKHPALPRQHLVLDSPARPLLSFK